MAKEKFIALKFRKTSLIVIEEANRIINEYLAAGYKMTLRQLYYQFISRDTFPADWIDEAYNKKNGLQPDTKNTEKNYKKLGELLSNARKAGLVDWNAIEDRTRHVRQMNMWPSPGEILQATAEQYRENPWNSQPYYVELWVEKDALLGVIGRIANRWRLPYLACKGYASVSELYDAGRRFARARRAGKHGLILHFGDHDPSGIDMSRDNGVKANLFSRGVVEFRRMALTMDQVEQYDPPPNPAKETDSRYGQYQADYGDTCWEVDALSPPVMDQILGDAVNDVIDWDAWKEAMENESANRAELAALFAHWPEVSRKMHKDRLVAEPEAPYDPRESEVEDDEEEDEAGE